MLEKYYRLKAKRKLLKQYRYINEVDKILEEYLTGQILKGGSSEFLGKSRNDLVIKQNAIKTQNEFIIFLSNLK